MQVKSRIRDPIPWRNSWVIDEVAACNACRQALRDMTASRHAPEQILGHAVAAGSTDRDDIPRVLRIVTPDWKVLACRSHHNHSGASTCAMSW